MQACISYNKNIYSTKYVTKVHGGKRVFEHMAKASIVVMASFKNDAYREPYPPVKLHIFAKGECSCLATYGHADVMQKGKVTIASIFFNFVSIVALLIVCRIIQVA